jgi:fumarate hydratase subunit beta
MAEFNLITPLHDNDIVNLKSGDRVYISGIIYTARDTAHKRLVNLIEQGKELPIDIKGQIIYYVGPTPARPGNVIGAAGPTTSYRMDSLTLPLLEKGLKGMIGKGKRSDEVQKALKDYKAVYFSAVGGAAALISKCIIKSEIIAYEDLGPEAIRRLEVKKLPVVVANDCHGNDVYKEAVKSYHLF